ncbi:hypothetical protein AJ78_07425 [Emergomyces pasteurianus Ep9510]|uniref:Major facilitator superfamily (MFS) profile domain-containing protein n=1 Tax=Emergomyces pasteurianus Ep9510 TaxID=1447872 RepID=A0A1J9Q6Q2_9EURO|nr:hypothetical protein AJ78_07425 [Emergomyces pasteurianus Ep9510]
MVQETVAEAPQADESAPLLGGAKKLWTTTYTRLNGEPHSTDEESLSEHDDSPQQRSIMGILSVLLIGVFVSQADSSLILATNGEIASEFDSLDKASWLMTSFILAMCVSQPMYGQLSNIFGRKNILLLSYTVFGIGTVMSGLGRNMMQVIAGRAIQGAGAAGMVSLVSILITDLVPMRDVAAYRSYVNIAQTVGRSSGGAIGGYIAQLWGWRGALLVQCPLTVMAIAMVAWKLHVPSTQPGSDQSSWSKVKRIDFPGMISLGTAVFLFLLILEIGGDIGWASPLLISLAIATLCSGVAFGVTEKYWATEPIFPLKLLTHLDVLTEYVILFIQTAIQTTIMFIIPTYFQVTQNVSTATAGAFLIPSIAGNTVGGLVTGAWIKKHAKYKLPIITSSVASIVGFASLLLLWRGSDNLWQTLLVFPSGLATGIAHSAAFVALTASVEDSEIAIACSGLYLSANVGAVIGLSASNALYQGKLQSGMYEALKDIEGGKKIAKKALSNIKFVQGLKGHIRDLVVEVYISSFHRAFCKFHPVFVFHFRP